jgi:hypothetical protein
MAIYGRELQNHFERMRSSVTQGQLPCQETRIEVNVKQARWPITRSRWGRWRDEPLMCGYEMSGKPGNRDLVPVPVVTGECPTMYKAVRGRLKVLSGFKSGGAEPQNLDEG